MIALITPTGGRTKQIQLCAKWMQQQTYEGKVLWVIVDDCMPMTSHVVHNETFENLLVKHVFPQPYWSPGDNTQRRNLLAGVAEVEKYESVDTIFIIEDDDYYTPTYLETMMQKIKGYDAAGQVRSLYFNVQNLTYRRYINTKHSSLFQTALNARKLPVFKQVLEKSKGMFIDLELWDALKNDHINLFDGPDLAIGMKGMPGRPGIGSGHKIKPVQKTGTLGRMIEMRKIIGPDYIYYL